MWATCGTGTAAGLHVSPDGVTWTIVPTDSGQGSLPNTVVVGARSAGEALVSLGPELPLERLHENGTLTGLTAAPGIGAPVTYLGFTSRDVGYAIVGGSLWRTDDGGDTWARMLLGNP